MDKCCDTTATASDEIVCLQVTNETRAELEAIRSNPESHVQTIYDDLICKLNLQRDLFVQGMLSNVMDIFENMSVQLTQRKTTAVDKIKFCMDNCLGPKLDQIDLKTSNNQLILNQIKCCINKTIENELNCVPRSFKIKTRFVHAEFKFNPSELLNIQLEKLPDLEKVTCGKVLKKHFGLVYELSLTPYLNQVISASSDNSLKLWDLSKGKCVWTICINSPTFAVMGEEIICVENEGNVKLYDLKTGKLKRIFMDVKFEVSSIQVIDKDTFLTGLFDGEILVWSKSKSKLIDTLPGHFMNVTSLKLLSQTQVISGSWDMSIKLWDLNEKKLIRDFEGHGNWVTCLEVFNEYEFLSGSKDGTIKIWHKNLDSCVETLHGHLSGVNSMRACENYQLFSCSDDGTIKHWDTVKGVCLKTLVISTACSVYDFLVMNDGSLVTTEDKTIKIWK